MAPVVLACKRFKENIAKLPPQLSSLRGKNKTTLDTVS